MCGKNNTSTDGKTLQEMVCVSRFGYESIWLHLNKLKFIGYFDVEHQWGTFHIIGEIVTLCGISCINGWHSNGNGNYPFYGLKRMNEFRWHN